MMYPHTPQRNRPALSLLMFLVTACGGQTVEPLSPRDLTLSHETRRWIADAEDGVIVARARRDASRAGLAMADRRRDEMAAIGTAP